MARDPAVSGGGKRGRSKADAAPADDSGGFDPRRLDRTVIAMPLLDRMAERGGRAKLHPVIIDLNLDFPGGRALARERVDGLLQGLKADRPTKVRIDALKGIHSQQYVFCSLSGPCIRTLVERDTAAGMPRAIYKIWPDFEVGPLTNRTIATIKADAARNAFGALGDGIVWAVIDTGIDGLHPHFAKHENLDCGLMHRDFSQAYEAGEEQKSADAALVDLMGHGTHVAGIIAGEIEATEACPIVANVTRRDEQGRKKSEALEPIPRISGMAPRCRLLSLKALDIKDNQTAAGQTSSLIAALEYIQELNGYGRRIRVHGVNLSVGYNFDPDWFACGQSPLCVEVDRLVRSGVVVVVAAGNTGYGWVKTKFRDVVPAGMDLSINDPGNAELAITVGSTHRDMPHIYGVSYFSSKGPTGDGRQKPDLVAPGEKILSAASGGDAKASPPEARYREESGTSMAAPHVSGAIAAFLSIRSEFNGQAEAVKRIFLDAATDLGRVHYFQGRGVVDLMRAIQSV